MAGKIPQTRYFDETFDPSSQLVGQPPVTWDKIAKIDRFGAPVRRVCRYFLYSRLDTTA